MSADEQPKERRTGARRASSAAPSEEPGVLSSLPSTRPQRPSARRAAARQRSERGAARGQSTATTAVSAKPTGTVPAKPTGAARRRRPPKPAEPPVPRQGFETDHAIEPGRPVQPPTGAELAASVVELVGELAQSGLSAGGRVLRDALSRLSGS